MRFCVRIGRSRSTPIDSARSTRRFTGANLSAILSAIAGRRARGWARNRRVERLRRIARLNHARK
jgi:hypothetical protein